MVKINRIAIKPPLLNSSCAWASDLEQLTELYDSPYTGAVTTRTATKGGFKQNATHMVLFAKDGISSINSFGYSPHKLAQYIEWIEGILKRPTEPANSSKPFVISITSSNPSELSEMIAEIQEFRLRLDDDKSTQCRIAIEINTSCPNIDGAPPPAYIPSRLEPLLDVLAQHFWRDQTLTIGLKLPPYVYAGQFTDMVSTLAKYSQVQDGEERNPIAFLTCTNTLGSSTFFKEQLKEGEVAKYDPELGEEFMNGPYALPTLSGGVGGDTIHSLSVWNVHSFAKLLAESTMPSLRAVSVIGVGGVTSPQAVKRMHIAGAVAVACATYLGAEGVRAFKLLST